MKRQELKIQTNKQKKTTTKQKSGKFWKDKNDERLFLDLIKLFSPPFIYFYNKMPGRGSVPTPNKS